MVRSWTAAFELPLLPSAGDDDKNQDVLDHMISVEAVQIRGDVRDRTSGYRGASAQSPISARRRRKFFLRSESCGNFD